MNNVKEIDHDTCRSRSDIRNVKDLYRISTSKLSKKELEDVYYSLFDNNLELKKTINAQKDQIKMMTTRLSRLAQKNISSPQKGCCQNTLIEHKEIIIDLKQANEKLVERVRVLNMQLCSAKQFVKRNPLQTTRCQNCANIRNSSSITLLSTKRSQPHLRTKSTASQYEHDITPILLEENIKVPMPSKDQEACTQNKCKSAIEELQLKIEDMQKELSKANEQYASQSRKFTDYENEVCSLKKENSRIRAQALVWDDKLTSQRKEYQELLKTLRAVEAQSETVSLELNLEKLRTRELETQLKAAELSHNYLHALSQAAARVHGSRELIGIESLAAMRSDEPLTTMRVDEPLTPMIVESLSPTNTKSSLIPVRIHDSLTPMTNDESSPVKNESPSKVEQSDDSGYLEATNKLIDHGVDTRLDRISEQPKEEATKANSDDYKRKKRKGKGRKSKRDSSIDSSVDHPSSVSSRDLSETRVDLLKKDNVIENIEQHRNNEDSVNIRKILRDVGVQSIEKKYVSRAVGGVLEGARTDAEVQIGDSLCAMPDIDTRTYSRKSHRTYSVEAVPVPPPPADNTECEISSLSDLPTERDSAPSDFISPGEAVASSDCTGASSWSELSEGELPVPRHKLSYGEVNAETSVGETKWPISPRVRIDRAMRTAKEEADRVARLLAGRPVDLPGVTVNPLVLLRARYQ